MKLFHQLGEKLVSLKRIKKQEVIVLGAGLLLGGFFYCQNYFLPIAWAKEGKASFLNKQEEEFEGEGEIERQKEEVGLCENLQEVESEVGLAMKELCERSNFRDEPLTEIIKKEDEQKARNEQEKFEKAIGEVLKGTPMSKMTTAIAQQEKIVAAFLVGIALKESSFGVHAPSKNGRDCYNYWGYKGSSNLTVSGYSCFSSPEQAVQVVGKRLEKLAINQKLDTPAKMIIWKCGNSCSGHDPAGVAKWIKDVSINFHKINNI
ncbi:MAG TPA: hypothetical protein GX706_03230 [Candidatus Moranbacteria bacterium]|nr:hypothetical protein [Candidatus Moranbacteria bacterium]